MLVNFISVLLDSVEYAAANEPSAFRLAVLTGFILAAVCWWGCSAYTRLWNTGFRIMPMHHVFCAFASACTLCFVILFVSLSETKDVALASIGSWQEQINADVTWRDSTFALAYQNVRALGIEDFANVPPPGSPGASIPVSSDASRQVAASTFATEACQHFEASRPFLSRIVWSSPGVPSEQIFEDVRAWHEHDPNYPPSRAIEIAAARIRDGLEVQLPRVVLWSRLAVSGLFALIQLVPVGLIGWAAYRDIKVRS